MPHVVVLLSCFVRRVAVLVLASSQFLTKTKQEVKLSSTEHGFLQDVREVRYMIKWNMMTFYFFCIFGARFQT